MEVPKETGKQASFKTVTIKEIFLNHMNILFVGREKNIRPDMNSIVNGRKKKLFNRVWAYFAVCSCQEKVEGPRCSLCQWEGQFIDLVNEELNPAPLVHSSARIRSKKMGELEDENYREERFAKIRRKNVHQKNFFDLRHRWRRFRNF